MSNSLKKGEEITDYSYASNVIFSNFYWKRGLIRDVRIVVCFNFIKLVILLITI